MRKVKITPQDDGTFIIEGKESHPEIKGKKLIILTQGQLSGEGGKETGGYKLAGDEAILLTEEEFEGIKKKIASRKSKAA